MLQEIVAKTLSCALGNYRHFVGSMHLYDKNRNHAQFLVEECFQSRVEMPPMPTGDPWGAIQSVLIAEARIRNGQIIEANLPGLDPYWADLIRLLQIFFSSDDQRIEQLRDSMSFQRYRPYITTRIGKDRDAK